MLRQPDTVVPFRFSTRDVPLHGRLDAIRALRERNILPIEPLPGHVPDARIARWSLPGVGILTGSLYGLVQQGVPQAAVSDEVFFGINLAGSSAAIQSGREATFGDGGAVLLSCAERSFSIPRPTRAQFVGLRVPRKRLAPLVAGLDDKLMRVVPGQTPALRLLSDYLAAMLNDALMSSIGLPQVATLHLLDLIALSLGAMRDQAALAQQRGGRAARLQAIKSDIIARLQDGSLTVVDIAARHRMTPRYVHKLFESDGATCAQFVLGQRLERAYRMLCDHRFAARSISSIAYDVGFDDLSYFNRTFRRHYNATPSDIRNGARSFSV